MKTIDIIILSIFLISITYVIFLLIRTHKVYKFIINIIDLESDKWFYFYNKLPSYYKIIWSFKKLRIENFYSEEDVKEINNILKIKKHENNQRTSR